MVMTVLVTIAMNLYARISMGRSCTRSLKACGTSPDPEYPVVQASAFSYRRYQVGPRPLVNLFHPCVSPWRHRKRPAPFSLLCA